MRVAALLFLCLAARIKAQADDSNSEIWDYMTRFDNTFLGGDLYEYAIGQGHDTAASCAERCAEDGYCDIWAWCPPDAGPAGCTASGFMCGDDNLTLASSDCFTTFPLETTLQSGATHNRINGTSMMGLAGPGISFVSGYFKTREKTELATDELPTAVVEAFTVEKNTFYALPAGPGEPAAAASLAECAERCLALPMCRAWSWCPPEEEGGCSTPIYYCSQPFEASPGTCALSEDGADTVAFVKIDALETNFVSGMMRRQAAAAAPAPAPAA